MNLLSLRVVPSVLDGDLAYQAVEITIDGKSLIELVRTVEEPFAKREGHPNIAGAYTWLSLSPETLESLQISDAEARYKCVELLQCSCGFIDCWPLRARISVSDEKVVWSEFERPHRRNHPAGRWGYEALGPFTFDRGQYEEELRSIY